MDEREQIIQDAFNRLPEVVQDAITDGHVRPAMRALSDKYNLHLDKWTILENEIMFALLGLSDPAELTEHIANQVRIPTEQAASIASDVSRDIFGPIQQNLQKSLTPNGGKDGVSYTKEPIDISKFSATPVDPKAYVPPTRPLYPASNDPYHEPVEQ